MELAQPAVFGKGAGCELVKETCDAYVKETPTQNYYCPKERKDGKQLQVTPLQQQNDMAPARNCNPVRFVSCCYISCSTPPVPGRC